MEYDMSILSLILGASLIVQIVMLLLLLASVGSWTVMFKKRAYYRKAQNETDKFEDRFWAGNELGELYDEASGKNNLVGMEALFVSGFREFQRQYAREDKPSTVESVDAIERAMKVRLSREIDTLESELPFLATVGSTSPYIGLFGTVWGIMNSFRALGDVKQATLAMVAPGIAEALVATAMGLFAAIPAVIAYNNLVSRSERIETRWETFVSELTHILERHLNNRSS